IFTPGIGLGPTASTAKSVLTSARGVAGGGTGPRMDRGPSKLRPIMTAFLPASGCRGARHGPAIVSAPWRGRIGRGRGETGAGTSAGDRRRRFPRRLLFAEFVTICVIPAAVGRPGSRGERLEG